METRISPYIATWIEFVPTNGIVTKHDRRIFGDALLNGTETTHRKHFPSRQMAVDYINSFSGKLDKQYKCLLFSDKQFAMAKEGNGYAIPYTQKQLNEAYYIG